MSKRALIIGGTGPTGPDVVQGMLDRGYETAIFHGGQHEIPLPAEVEHIHGDAHFADTIAAALGAREFDVVIAQYGRLRHLVSHLAGRTGHLIAIGGMNSPLARPDDSRWGPLGRPAVVREESRLLLEEEDPDNKLGFKIAEASRTLFDAGNSGAFKATYIVYPTLYGPRQPGCPEWHIVRRVQDGRRRLILPEGGLRLESRGFNRNVAQAPLLATDRPDVAAGKTYVVTDEDIYSIRQRVEFIAKYLGVELEIVDMPFEFATPAHPFYRMGPTHRVGLSSAIRDELGFEDRFGVDEALAQTVEWLKQAAPDTIGEVEKQLGDPFDYAYEDELLEWWSSVRADRPQSSGGEYSYSHIYRHPKAADESWTTKKP